MNIFKAPPKFTEEEKVTLYFKIMAYGFLAIIFGIPVLIAFF